MNVVMKDGDSTFERWRFDWFVVFEKWQGINFVLVVGDANKPTWILYMVLTNLKIVFDGCGIYFPTVLESKVIVSKSLWNICWKFCAIKLLLANERCITIGLPLVIDVCFERSHGVAKGGKIYKCNTHGGSSRG